MPRKALFFPSCRGGGFGHISRCLALACEMERRGWEVTFALEGQHAGRVERMGRPVLRVRRDRPRLTPWLERLYGLLRRHQPSSPAYLLFSDMSYQIARDGFYGPGIVRRAAEADIALVRRIKPDILIGDTWPLTHMVGRRADLPVVQVIKTILHPQHPDLYWWDTPPSGLISPNVLPVFNPVFESWGMAPIRRAEDTLRGDLFIVPSIPSIDPLPGHVTSTHYVGTLAGTDGASATDPAYLQQMATDRPLIYVTMGGGAEPVDARRLYAMLRDSLSDPEWQVIVSTGRGVSPDVLPRPPENMIVRDWVPGAAVIRRSDVVVYHGGYGTTMETVRYGVPSVVLPFHTEQESNGRRIESCGAARVLSPASVRETMRLVRSRWPYGEFTTWVQPESPLTPEALRQAVADVLTQPGYRVAARALSEEASRYGGAEAASDLIEKLT